MAIGKYERSKTAKFMLSLNGEVVQLIDAERTPRGLSRQELIRNILGEWAVEKRKEKLRQEREKISF